MAIKAEERGFKKRRLTDEVASGGAIDLGTGGLSRKRVKLERREIHTNGSNDWQQFNDGSIIRIRVKNFVTYSATEFELSPTLNMIIGPNGTGKSTFVCAICLGLGGKPELLGRQKYTAEFIKEGTDVAEIEIVLRYRNSTVAIRREMVRKTKVKEKSEWYFDGVRRDEKYLKQLLGEMKIQLSNLCCFLPQDKVSSFAAMKPELLLLETERAAGHGELLESHQRLIEIDSSSVDLRAELARGQELLGQLKQQRDGLKEEAEKYLRFQDKKQQHMYHEKLLPYAIVLDRRKAAVQYKRKRDEFKSHVEQFEASQGPLEDALSNESQELEAAEKTLEDLHETMRQEQRVFNRLSKDKSLVEQRLEQTIKEQQQLVNRSQRKKEELKILHDEISGLEQELVVLEVPDEVKIAEMTSKKNDTRQKRYDLKNTLGAAEDSKRAVQHRVDKHSKTLSGLRRQVESHDKIAILVRMQRNRMYGNCYQAVLKLRNTPELQGKVFEPPILSISVTDDRYSKYLEIIIDPNTRVALTAKSKQVYNEVVDGVFRGINVGFRYPGELSPDRTYSKEKVQQEFGFDGYLIDFIRGPEEVKSMLYDTILYDTPVSLKELSPGQMEKVKSRDPKTGRPYFTKFIVGDVIYNLTASNYGSKQVVSRSQMIYPSKSAIFDSRNANQAVEEDIKKCQQEIKNELQQASVLDAEIGLLSQQIDALNGEYDFETSSLANMNNLKSKRLALQTKISRKKENSEALKQEADRDVSGALSRIVKKRGQLTEEKVDSIVNMVEPVRKINRTIFDISRQQFTKFDIFNKKEWIENLMGQAETVKLQLVEKLRQAQEKYDFVRQSDEVKKLKKTTKEYSEELRTELGKLAEKYQQEGLLNERDIRVKIDLLASEIGSLDHTTSSSIKKLQAIETRISDLETQLPDLEQQLAVVEQELDLIRIPWEEKLDCLVNDLSENFSQKFLAVASAGEVRLNKQPRFSDWRLELLVKFRDEADLRVLDPFIQSGGERAVSTIFFMLSLQGLTQSPFRVVDEINQGMDPNNERIVHKYMVESACQADSAGIYSQYFLITPKLLTNLFYHEKMAVHCILANHDIPETVWDT